MMQIKLQFKKMCNQKGKVFKSKVEEQNLMSNFLYLFKFEEPP